MARGLPAIDLKIINLRRELLSVYPRWGFTITGARAWPDRARFVRPEFVDAFNFTTMTKRLGSAPAGMLPPPGPLMDGRSRGAGCEERPVLVVRVACPSDTAAIVSLVNDAFRAEAWVFAAGDEYRRTCEAEVAAYVAAGEMLVAAVAGDVEEGSAACALFSHVSPMTPLTVCVCGGWGGRPPVLTQHFHSRVRRATSACCLSHGGGAAVAWAARWSNISSRLLVRDSCVCINIWDVRVFVAWPVS